RLVLGPLLTRLRHVLALVLADRAALRRLVGRRVLRGARRAEPGLHRPRLFRGVYRGTSSRTTYRGIFGSFSTGWPRPIKAVSPRAPRPIPRAGCAGTCRPAASAGGG